MKTNRAAAQGRILKRMKELDPSGKQFEYYQNILPKMSDSEFDRFMFGLKSGSNPLTAVIPNFTDVQITVDNNIKLAASMGYDFYQRIWITDPATGRRYLTPGKHLVCDSNVCKQVQTVDHKISVAKNNDKIDNLTGQPTGESNSARCSGPEMMILSSQGFTSPLVELLKFRGGDNTSRRIAENQIIKTGSAKMAAVPGADLRTAKSVKTMSIILNGMMLTNNFAG